MLATWNTEVQTQAQSYQNEETACGYINSLYVIHEKR